MSKSKFLYLAVATAAALSLPAFAADSQNMAVSATVSGICKLTSVPAMTFPALDPSVNAPVSTAAIPVVYKCTKGTPAGAFTVGASATGTYTSGATSATGALVGTGANTDVLQFSIAWAVPGAWTGLGFGNAGNTVNLTGTIVYAQFQNATADTYSKNVAITIDP